MDILAQPSNICAGDFILAFENLRHTILEIGTSNPSKDVIFNIINICEILIIKIFEISKPAVSL